MNTTTRATYASADLCHASTATKPLIRPYGVIMPAGNHTKKDHCATIAAAYREALNNPKACMPVTDQLKQDARVWLMDQFSQVVKKGYWPVFLDGIQPLEIALQAFNQPPADGEYCRMVPVSCDNNDPHPVWSRIENLLFRFVHDYAHFVIGADTTFDGELAVTRHTLTADVRANDALARFLASESVGQIALANVDKVYPAQVIAAGILELI